MLFWGFVACAYCTLSSTDIGQVVTADQLRYLPRNKSTRKIFFVTTFPPAIGVFALPIYGFFIMPWWQTIGGILIALVAVNIITRKLLAGSSWLYLWSMFFSVTGIAFFTCFVA